MQQGPYFGQVAPISPIPSGYLEGAANIGRTLNQSISGLGENISKAIEQYRQTKDENDFVNQKLEMTSGVLERFKNDPTKQDDPRVQKMIDGLAKFPGMSLTQKKAFLNDSEFLVNRFDKEQAQQNEIDRLALERQRALFEGTRLNNETQMTNARLAEMAKTFTPSGSMVTLPDGTKVPMVMTSPNSAQPVQMQKAAELGSPIGKLIQDRNQLLAAGDHAAAGQVQSAIDNEANKAPNAPKLELSEKTFMANAQEYMSQLKELEDTVKKYGNAEVALPVVGSKGSVEASAKLDSLPYKMAITYAKIVDPQSVAREGEVEAAKKYVIPLGWSVNNDKTLAAIKNQRDEIARRIEQFNEVNADKLKGKPVPTPEQPQGIPQFKTMAEANEAQAKGFRGVVEIYDASANKFRKYRID